MPKSVEFYSRKRLERVQSDQWISYNGSTAVVRIEIFGMHSTGGRGQPWLGLDVVCEPGLVEYSPRRLRSTPPDKYWVYRKITNDIYEFY